MPYVYSTLSSNVNYAFYERGGDVPVKTRQVIVRGGTGVINNNFVTPEGVATMITDEEAELLRTNSVFKMHEKNGFVKIDSEKKKIAKAVSDLESKDKGAQKTAADFKRKSSDDLIEEEGRKK